MYFTREPLVETVITAKEGHKLVIRNSKGGGQEEFSAEAIEVISFGQSCFYRSLEKAKAFLVPVTDYEVVEVREARMVLKTPQVERGIKIGGGKERPKEVKVEEETVTEEKTVEKEVEAKGERRRERRRFRRRKEESREAPTEEATAEGKVREEKTTHLIPAPTTLISETLSRYKDIPGFAGAFFDRENKESVESEAEETPIHDGE